MKQLQENNIDVTDLVECVDERFSLPIIVQIPFYFPIFPIWVSGYVSNSMHAGGPLCLEISVGSWI